MNDRTNYPRGSPRDILERLQRIEREYEQMLADANSVNEHNPNFADVPMDVGRYVVALSNVRRVIANVREVIAAGAERLPPGILDPIL